MPETLIAGRVWEITWQVTAECCAHVFGNPGVHVFATPALIGLIERTAIECVAPCLERGQVTVGTHLDVSHLSATPPGLTVRCRATFRALEGRRLRFDIEVRDPVDLVARGTHERALVHLDRFLEKAGRKNLSP